MARISDAADVAERDGVMALNGGNNIHNYFHNKLEWEIMIEFSSIISDLTYEFTYFLSIT